MKSILGYLLAGIAAYLVFLAVQFPADRAYALLAQRLDLPVALYQLEGSAWRGEARELFWEGRRLGRVTWQFRPQSLVLGRLEARVHLTPTASSRLEAVAGRRWDGALYLRAGDARLSLAELEPLFNRDPMGLTGILTVTLEELDIEAGRITALRGRAVIEKAGLAPPVDVTVGGFEVDFDLNPEGFIEARLKDRGGPLQAQGQLRIQPDGSYRLSATLAARDPRRSDIRQALGYLGTPGPDGRISLVRTGKWAFLRTGH